jgi:hypothetical protein
MPPELTLELYKLCECVRRGLSKVYGRCVLFEHGVRGDQSGGCGIDHAHLHAVPLTHAKEPIRELRQRHAFRNIPSIAQINDGVSPSSSYLYYEGVNRRSCVFEIDFLPSQYLRKLLAESMGVDMWDWREYGREQALVSSLVRLSDVLNPTTMA